MSLSKKNIANLDVGVPLVVEAPGARAALLLVVRVDLKNILKIFFLLFMWENRGWTLKKPYLRVPHDGQRLAVVAKGEGVGAYFFKK